MITSWNYGVNSRPEFRRGTIYLREEPWWLAFCGWAIDHVIGHGCRLLHWAKLPSWINIEMHGEHFSLYEYYGDIGSIYHFMIYNPLFQWHYGHRRAKTYHVEIGYDRVKELFGGRDAEFFAEQEK